jgi:hypothetical protein
MKAKTTTEDNRWKYPFTYHFVKAYLDTSGYCRFELMGDPDQLENYIDLVRQQAYEEGKRAGLEKAHENVVAWREMSMSTCVQKTSDGLPFFTNRVARKKKGNK